MVVRGQVMETGSIVWPLGSELRSDIVVIALISMECSGIKCPQWLAAITLRTLTLATM